MGWRKFFIMTLSSGLVAVARGRARGRGVGPSSVLLACEGERTQFLLRSKG